jgi:hypothetical protein
MNGARAELPPNTINKPRMINTTISGVSHHFFLVFKKFQRSLKKSISHKIRILRFPKSTAPVIPHPSRPTYHGPASRHPSPPLRALIKDQVPNHQAIHFRLHQATESLLRSIHNGFIANIKARIDQHRATG